MRSIEKRMALRLKQSLLLKTLLCSIHTPSFLGPRPHFLANRIAKSHPWQVHRLLTYLPTCASKATLRTTESTNYGVLLPIRRNAREGQSQDVNVPPVPVGLRRSRKLAEKD